MLFTRNSNFLFGTSYMITFKTCNTCQINKRRLWYDTIYIIQCQKGQLKLKWIVPSQITKT